MPAEYLLSVDLGTSHTVAVVVWPDGRTRPLLFDGSPVMPSAVFLDPAGNIHTGKDAERLGSTIPERFEPNPKQRVSDGTLLLGDREIPVTAAFSAILARVARGCVEAIGHLPKAVLTCPAAWGEQRRGALHDAAAKAGYPPVQIITEPVAAAHYYTSRLAHPLTPGQALAVFDFGGGTLDIAVLERRHDGSFGVLADGGLPDLGGLDFDAALVARIGETVKQREPEIWKKLENPSGASEMRNRRELWEEVRAAKEMLSRSSVAPVTVPDMAQSLHLTRGELDQLSRPLLARAVGETQRVLGLTGRRPDQLAGLFLVGGSSRMPMVSKMLHEALGIAPTVLEQPELPVSEGAALAFASPAPVTPPAVSPPQSPPHLTGAGSLPPVTPAHEETLQLRRKAPEQTPRRLSPKWIAIIAGIAVLAIAIPIAWWWLTNPYKQRPFAEELTEVGDPISYAGEPNDGINQVRVRGDKALFAYTVDHPTETEELHLMAVDTATGDPLWGSEAVISGDGWDDNYYVSEELIAFSQEVEGADGNLEYDYHFLDWETGEVRTTVTSGERDARRSGDQLVVATSGNQLDVYDATGETVASWGVGNAEESVSMQSWGLVGDPGDLVNPAETVNGDGRIWALTGDGVVHIYDIESRDLLAEREIESAEDAYFAWNGLMYVTVQKGSGYELNVYDIENKLSEVDSQFLEEDGLTTDRMIACGEHLVCVREPVPDEIDIYHWRVYDSGAEKFVHEFNDLEYSDIEPVGDRLLVEYYEGTDLLTQVYDKDFDRIGNVLEETFTGIDGGSALAYPGAGASAFSTSTGKVVGLGVRDNSRVALRTDLEVQACDASDTHLACLLPDGMQVYSFREE